MNTDSANKFIAALVKSLQTLCHGYVEFDDGIEIIGHLYLNIDSGSTFDYVVKEKVCKNAENATVFVSKSFHAEGSPENTLINDKNADNKLAVALEHDMSASGTNRLQSAITNISNVLSGAPGHHPSHSSSPHNTGKRKREHNGNYSHQPPYKYTTLQTSASSAMPYFSNNPAKHHPSNRDNSKHYNNPQSEFFGGDSNQSSGMGPEDEEDLDLDVTFVKEEYAERNAAHRSSAAARAHQDPSANPVNMLPENNGGEGGGSYPMGYHPNQNAPNQSFVGGSGGDMSGMSQQFQDPSQVDVGQHHIPPPPNPRTTLTSADGTSTLLPSTSPFNLASGGFVQSSSFSESGKLKGESMIHTIRQNKWAVSRARDDATAGPPPRMPEGVKPLCGYVHPDDAKKWMMYELLPGSGVFIHQENYNVVLSKTRQDRPDGKAMARYLMSCFWRQSELVGASIAEPPKPHQRSLDRGIIHAILGFCQHHSRELSTDIRRTMQQKIGYAKFYFVRKTQDPDSPKTPATISAEASPRRMSMEMARRNAAGIPIEPLIRPSAKRSRRASETLSRMLPEDALRLSLRASASETPPRVSIGLVDIPPRLSLDSMPGRPASSSAIGDLPSLRMGEIGTERLPTDMSSRSSEISSRLPSDLSNRMLNDMTCRLPNDLSNRLRDFPSHYTSEMVGRLPVPGPLPEDLAGRPAESSASDIVNRLSGTMPTGMSRGFLDMLNNIYPNN